VKIAMRYLEMRRFSALGVFYLLGGFYTILLMSLEPDGSKSILVDFLNHSGLIISEKKVVKLAMRYFEMWCFSVFFYLLRGFYSILLISLEPDGSIKFLVDF
jgi:hypothetical protein